MQNLRRVGGLLLCFAFMNEENIACVNAQAKRLPDDEHKIVFQNGVNQQHDAATDAEQPENFRHCAAPHFLAMYPLGDKAHHEQGLTQKAKQH